MNHAPFFRRWCVVAFVSLGFLAHGAPDAPQTGGADEGAYAACVTAVGDGDTTAVLDHCGRASEHLLRVGAVRERTPDELGHLAYALHAVAWATPDAERRAALESMRAAGHFLRAQLAAEAPARAAAVADRLALHHHRMAVLLEADGRHAEALDELRTVMELAQGPHGNPAPLARIAARANVGVAEVRAGHRLEGARRLAGCLTDLRTHVSRADPPPSLEEWMSAGTTASVVGAGADLAGDTPGGDGAPDAAEALQLSVRCFGEAVALDPADADASLKLADALLALAGEEMHRCRMKEAGAAVTRAVAVTDGLVTSTTEMPPTLPFERMRAHAVAADVSVDTWETTAAETHLNRAMDILRAEGGRIGCTYAACEADMLGWMLAQAHLLALTGRPGPALDLVDHVLAEAKELGVEAEALRADCLDVMAFAMAEQGDTISAVKALPEVVGIRERAVAVDDTDSGAWLGLGEALLAMGETVEDDAPALARHAFARARVIGERLTSGARPDASAPRHLLARALLGLATTDADTSAARALALEAHGMIGAIPRWEESAWLSATMAVACVRLGRVDEARPLVRRMIEANWRTRFACELAEATGLNAGHGHVTGR